MNFNVLIIASVISFTLAALAGPIMIPILHRLKFGQEIREIGPSWHKNKTGTPTMGGFIFIIPALICALILFSTSHLAGNSFNPFLYNAF